MARYSKALKESVIQKMVPPNNVPVPKLVRETGISDVTLYSWRRKAVSQGVPVPGDGKNPDQWTPQNKLAVVIETAALNQAELSAYCRKKGLFAEQTHQWKEACVTGVSAKSDHQPAQRKALAEERITVKTQTTQTRSTNCQKLSDRGLLMSLTVNASGASHRARSCLRWRMRVYTLPQKEPFTGFSMKKGNSSTLGVPITPKERSQGLIVRRAPTRCGHGISPFWRLR